MACLLLSLVPALVLVLLFITLPWEETTAVPLFSHGPPFWISLPVALVSCADRRPHLLEATEGQTPVRFSSSGSHRMLSWAAGRWTVRVCLTYVLLYLCVFLRSPPLPRKKFIEMFPIFPQVRCCFLHNPLLEVIASVSKSCLYTNSYTICNMYSFNAAY